MVTGRPALDLMHFGLIDFCLLSASLAWVYSNTLYGSATLPWCRALHSRAHAGCAHIHAECLPLHTHSACFMCAVTCIQQQPGCPTVHAACT